MNAVVEDREPLRPVIAWAVAVCLGAAVAPWFSGGQEPLGMMLSGFALLLGAGLLCLQPNVRYLQGGPLKYTYYALLGWGVLSLIWTANRYSAVLWIVGLALAGVAFRLAYALTGEEGGRQKLIWVYLVSAMAFVAYGLYLYLSGGYDRFTSSFYWPNPAAAYLIPAIFITFDALRRGGKWWYGALTALFGASFLLSDSRATGLVLLILVIIYCLCIKLNKRFWISLLFTVLAAIGLAYGMVVVRHVVQPKAAITAPGTRLAPAAANNVQSGTDRWRYLESTFHIWAAQPILGTGAGTFADVHPAYQGRVVSASSSAHNVYAQTFAELGLVGGLLLLWLLVCMAGGVVRGLWVQPMGLALALGSAGLWLHFGLDIDAQYPALVLLASMFGGVLFYQKPSYRPMGWQTPVLAMLVLVPLVCLYFSDTNTIRGRAAQADDDYELAGRYFAAAHATVFYNPDVLSAEGIMQFTMSLVGDKAQLERALALARQAEAEDSRDGQHHELEGFALDRLGDHAGAAKAYRRALALDPYNHPEYAYDLAMLQERLGQSDEALATINAMLAQYPPEVVANRAADPKIRSNLANLAVLVGTIALKQGDVAAAQAASKRALAFDATNVRAQALATVLTKLPVAETQ